MKINLAKSAGFCFGVKRAIEIAIKTAALGKEVHMLGDIVHNEDVVKDIQKHGIKKILRLSNGQNRIFLVRAHGAATKLLDLARRKKYRIIDATCPMVKEIHRIVTAYEKRGYKIIVIGDKKHDEVQGIIGHVGGRATVIDKARDLPWKELRGFKKACVVAQSTQNAQHVLKIIEILKPHLGELKFFNTICQPTRIKQEEIRSMPKENEVMVVIGSKTSANTRRLFEISRSLNKRSYWVASKKDLRPDWFRDAKTVGITAGASTPDSTTKEIIKYLRNLS